jgi:acyl-CoA synthetase (AMP-forming)/AMP-acid ligase II
VELTVLDTTIASVVAEQAATRRDRAAITCGDASLTFGELHTAAQSFGAWMVSRGVAPGDHIALWLPNGLAWVVAQLAAAQAGAVTVPISTRLTTAEAAYIVGHARARLIVVVAEFLARNYGEEARQIAARLDRVPALDLLVVDSDGTNFPQVVNAHELPGSRPDAPAVVLYTSGTTGRPKGCVLSHRAWTNNARLSALLADIGGDDVVFSPSPFFHLFGSLTALMGSLSVGACLVTTPTFHAATAAEVIATTAATHLVAVPTVWLDLMAPHLAPYLGGLRGGRWGGGSFPRRALEHALAPNGLALRLDAIYGMTEAPTLTQARAGDSPASRLDTVGGPTPGVDLRIVDSESGREAKPGAIGEIAMRGYCRALGYLRDPGAMSDRVTDGWLRTGDLGTLDAEGCLRVTGRLTDMLISGGANVYAREVEEAVLEMDHVALVAVVPRVDPRLGEVPVAWVAINGDAAAGAEEAVIAHCRSRLAPYKVPRTVFIVPELPLTASGKIHKARLVEMTQHADRKAQR